MRPDAVRLATLAVGIGWFAVAGCAARNATVDAPTVQIIPDVSDEEWASAVEFDKALMKSPGMLHGSHRPSAASIAKGQHGIAKVATVIRKDGSVGFYRVVETNQSRLRQCRGRTAEGAEVGGAHPKRRAGESAGRVRVPSVA
jgi:hypothetical protein